MIVFLVLGGMLLIGAVTLFALALTPGEDRAGWAHAAAVLRLTAEAPKELTSDLEPDFADRIIRPMRARALSIGRRISRADASSRIQNKLDLAGNPAGLGVDAITSGKVLLGILGTGAGVAVSLVMGGSGTSVVLGALIGAVLGFLALDLYLYQLAYDRSEKLRRELPDAIDLMTISVEAGLGFDAAVQQVSRNTTGPLADEFSRMLREMQLGKGRAESLRGLGERAPLEEISSFVTAMVQADSFGIPIAQVLRVQSSEIRVKRRQWAERKAQQVPVKITVPLIFCILPCLLATVMGPAILSMSGKF